MGEKLLDLLKGLKDDPKVRTAAVALVGAVGAYLALHLGLIS